MATHTNLVYFLTVFSTYNLASVPIIEAKISADDISSSQVVNEIEKLNKFTNYLDLNDCRLNFLQNGYFDSEWTRFCFSLISLEKLRELNLNNNNLWELNQNNLSNLKSAISELSSKSLSVVQMLNNTNKSGEDCEECDNFLDLQDTLEYEEFYLDKKVGSKALESMLESLGFECHDGEVWIKK